MLVKRFNIITKNHYSIDLNIDEEKYIQYIDGRGGLIQNMFPKLNNDEREFILSGCFPGFFEGQFSKYYLLEFVCYQYDVVVFYVPEYQKIYIYLINNGVLENHNIIDFKYDLYTNEIELFTKNIDEIIKFSIMKEFENAMENNFQMKIDFVNSEIRRRITEFIVSEKNDNLNEVQNNSIIDFCNKLK